MNQSKKEIALEVLRFLVVGGIATIGDYVVSYLFQFVILKSLNDTLNQFISLALGFTTGLLINWFLQKFVFKYLNSSQTKSKMNFLKFFVLSLFGLLLTELVMWASEPVLFGYMYLDLANKLDFGWLGMKCVMTLIVLVINYFGRKYFVFREK